MAHRSTLRLLFVVGATAMALVLASASAASRTFRSPTGKELVPASASAAHRTFRAPTGKLGCAFYSDSHTPRAVRCEWRGSNDRTLTLEEWGRARRISISDTGLDPGAKVLAHGDSTAFGKLRCTSRGTGITCRSTRSGHGFTISLEKQRMS